MPQTGHGHSKKSAAPMRSLRQPPSGRGISGDEINIVGKKRVSENELSASRGQPQKRSEGRRPVRVTRRAG